MLTFFKEQLRRYKKKKLSITALLAGSSAAFPPAQVGKSSMDLHVFDSELGSHDPLGFFDPLGIL